MADELDPELNYIPEPEPQNWDDISGYNKADDNATRSQIFAQNAAPTQDFKEGDLWFDTDDSNKIYRANSALAWVSVQDGTIFGGAWDDITGATKPADNATVGATAGTDLKDSGTTVLQDREVKNILDLDYGETINGATLPVPVYVDTTDGEVYKCDADASGKLKFFGFAITNSTDGNSGKVQVSANVGGFSGLTKNALYYVSDTAGLISTTPGTITIPVGLAISATEIRVIDKSFGALSAGDNLIGSATTERTSTSDAYEKVKEIECTDNGTYRVKFTIRTDNGSDAVYGRIYKNGVAIGTERNTNSTSYVEYSQDIAFSEGDLIQLYIHRSGASSALSNALNIYVGGRQSLLIITS